MPTNYEREVYAAVYDAIQFEEIISRDIAMTIASWWHSSGSPNSTLLSTTGKVAPDVRLEDFASTEEYRNASQENRRCLEALDQYIRHNQNIGNVTHTVNTELVEIEFSETSIYTINLNF